MKLDYSMLCSRERSVFKVDYSIGFTPSSLKRFERVGSPLQHHGCVNTAKWSPDGGRLVTGSDDRTVKIWDASKDLHCTSLVETIETCHRSNIFCAEISPFNSNLVVSSAADGCVVSNDLTSPRFGEKILRSSSGMIHMFTFDIDQPQVLYTAEDCGDITRIDLRMGTHDNSQVLYKTFQRRGNGSRRQTIACKCLAQSFSLGTTQLIMGGEAHALVLLDMRHLRGNNNAALEVVFNSDVADPNSPVENCVKIWSPRFVVDGNSYPAVSQNAFLEETRGSDNSNNNNRADISVSGLQISKDGRFALASFQGDQIYMFDLFGQPDRRFCGESVPKIGAEYCFGGHVNNDTFLKTVSFFGPKDEYVLSGSDSGHIWIWETASGRLKRGRPSSDLACIHQLDYFGQLPEACMDMRENRLVKLLNADTHTCNGVIPHPFLPTFVSYGIESSAKLWADQGNSSVKDGLRKKDRCRYVSWPTDISSFGRVGSSLTTFDLQADSVGVGLLNDYMLWQSFLESQFFNRVRIASPSTKSVVADVRQYEQSSFFVRNPRGFFEELFGHSEETETIPAASDGNLWSVGEAFLLSDKNLSIVKSAFMADAITYGMKYLGLDVVPVFAMALLWRVEEMEKDSTTKYEKSRPFLDHLCGACLLDCKESWDDASVRACCLSASAFLATKWQDAINCRCETTRAQLQDMMLWVVSGGIFICATEAKQKGTAALQNKANEEALYHYQRGLSLSLHVAFTSSGCKELKNFGLQTAKACRGCDLCDAVSPDMFALFTDLSLSIANIMQSPLNMDLCKACMANTIVVQMQQGDMKHAYRACNFMKNVSSMEPRVGLDAKYYYRRGNICLALGNNDEAVECLQKAAALNPADGLIARKLKEAKSQLERLTKKAAKRLSDFFASGGSPK